MSTRWAFYSLAMTIAASAAGCKDSAASGGALAAKSAIGEAMVAVETSTEIAPPAEAGQSGVKDRFGTAAIRGVVRFEGKRPRRQPMKMRGDRACAHQETTVFSPGLTISESGGVPHVFVYVKEGVEGTYTAPTEVVSLDQKGCMFAPHVFGLQVGQPLRIVNSDATVHNVHSLTKRNAGFNLSQPVKGAESIRRFVRPEVMIKFRCDVHGWMEAYCGVLSHPFFAATNSDGEFEIGRLPPGRYAIEAWHEYWGTLRAEASVSDAEIKTLDFTYKRRRSGAADTARQESHTFGSTPR